VRSRLQISLFVAWCKTRFLGHVYGLVSCLDSKDLLSLRGDDLSIQYLKYLTFAERCSLRGVKKDIGKVCTKSSYINDILFVFSSL